jgi:hypothetical protein
MIPRTYVRIRELGGRWSEDLFPRSKVLLLCVDGLAFRLSDP